jgi:hypothetical protein
MALDLIHIARQLDLPQDELVKKGILSFISNEIRLAEWEITDIKDRYTVGSRTELERRIETRSIYSHPAWEDLIHWESLESYVCKLHSLAEELHLAA